MSIKVGDKVKATKEYLNEACSEAERAWVAEFGGLFGKVLKEVGMAYRVKWDAPGFSPDYDVAFASEIEKVDG